MNLRNTLVVAITGMALAACNTGPQGDTDEEHGDTADVEDTASEIETSSDEEAAETPVESESDGAEGDSALADAAAPVVVARSVRYGFDGPDLDACGGYGEVTGLKATGDGYLSVRAAPDVKGKELDRLSPGQGVTFCDSAKGESWIGIVYDKSGGKDCGTGSPIAAPSVYTGPCKSGWVSAKYVTLIAG